jgi:hypothetical protein
MGISAAEFGENYHYQRIPARRNKAHLFSIIEPFNYKQRVGEISTHFRPFYWEKK